MADHNEVLLAMCGTSFLFGAAAAISFFAAPGCCPATVLRYPEMDQTFTNLDLEDATKLAHADLQARVVLDDGEMLKLLEHVEVFDHKSDGDLSDDDGAALYAKLKAAFAHPRSFNGYTAFLCLSKAIAKDGSGGAIEVNRCALSERSEADYAGTIWHELAHQAGYRHNGNARRGNECTVPHLVGDAATALVQRRATGQPAVLPTDVCPALKAALTAVAQEKDTQSASAPAQSAAPPALQPPAAK